jgi:hypothetical protein
MHSRYRWLILLLTIPVFARSQFYVQNGASVTMTGNATIALQDIDLVVDGTISQQSGDGSWIITGVGDNFISGSSSPFFDKLQIAKTGSARIILLQNINFAGGVWFASGLIDLNNNHIILQPGAALNFESESSHITGANGGYIEAEANLNAPAMANPGNLGALITSGQNLGATVIRRGAVSQTNSFGGGSSILRYYDIFPSNNVALNATLRINYLDAELNGLDESALTLWKSTDSVHWTNMGYIARDATANYVEASGISDFSRWTLSTMTNPLPVRLTSFRVECLNGSARIAWSTAQEQNSSRFEVEKSTDGIQWQSIGLLAAAGNSSLPTDYAYTDANTANGIAFYRIAEFDIDGSSTYSATASASCGIAGYDATIYPNPVKDICRIILNTPVAAQLKIEIYNAAGARINTQIAALNTGANSISVNMESLSPGLYFMNLQWDNGQRSKIMKIVKE